MADATEVTIVGAGPYGLSLAAHLRRRGKDFRIVGTPMETWTSKMPEGMLLKSAGFASNLSEPDACFTLRRFCESEGRAYGDLEFPSLDTFAAYGLEFQRRYAPNLEDDIVVSLVQSSGGFELGLGSGKHIRTRNVVLAIGLNHFRRIPISLARLSGNQVSHSIQHRRLDELVDKRVAVVGSGASAINLAVLLYEKGGDVQLVARSPSLRFTGPWSNGSHPLLGHIRHPVSGIGPGWKHLLLAELPALYRYLPDAHRIRIARAFLGPAGGPTMRERAANLRVHLGCSLQEAKSSQGAVQLRLSCTNGSTKTIEVDHIIAATGFEIDLCRLPFLRIDVLDQVRLIGKAPRLSSEFQSSVPGLYFLGPVSAASFGPVMRFVYGARYASHRLARHLS